jgi:preprotein translocase subunit SecE
MKTESKEKKPNPFIHYLQESVQELKRVTWPTRNQAVRLTVLVLSFCFVCAIVIGTLDYVFGFGRQKLIELAPPATTSTDVTATTGQDVPVTSEPITVTPGTTTVAPKTVTVTPTTTSVPTPTPTPTK